MNNALIQLTSHSFNVILETKTTFLNEQLHEIAVTNISIQRHKQKCANFLKRIKGVLGLNLSTSTTTKLQICNIYLAFQNMSDLFQALF